MSPQARKIVLNVEHRVMLQLAPDYDALSLPQKVEVFDGALANTAGHDLSKVLWLKSSHSEQWLERRTHYSRSLAVMSMVGHIEVNCLAANRQPLIRSVRQSNSHSLTKFGA